MDPELEQALRERFDKLDKNADGQVTLEEARALMQGKGIEPDQSLLELYIARYDKDGNNKISWEEFKGLYANK